MTIAAHAFVIETHLRRSDVKFKTFTASTGSIYITAYLKYPYTIRVADHPSNKKLEDWAREADPQVLKYEHLQHAISTIDRLKKRPGR